MVKLGFVRIASALLSCFALPSAVSLGAAAAQTGATQVDLRPRLVLLGTAAGPVPRAERSQPANLLVVGGKAYLIDAGDGAARQLARAGVALSRLDAVFITHLHFDHVLGISPMMAFSWIEGRPAALPMWGPPGLREMIARTVAALDIGVDIFKPQMPPRPTLQGLFTVNEIAGDRARPFYVDGGNRVSALANTHYAEAHLPKRSYGIDRSLSYRFDTEAGSIVFTGDTGPSAAVEALAKDCDLLVAEVVDLPSVTAALASPFGGRLPPAMQAMRVHMEAEHLTPAELGKLAQRARVKKLVVTHFAMGPTGNPEALRREIGRYYTEGDIIMGTDMMVVPID